MVHESKVAVRKRAVAIGFVMGVLALLTGCFLFNTPPLAEFTMSPDVGEAPLTVEFDASDSSDPDGSIASYEWDFGDGGSGTGVSLEHEFATAGTYEITLTVTDNRGKATSVTQDLTVVAGGSGPPPPPPPPSG